MNVRLYVWQRLTAAIMAPLVLAHIVVIFYATRKGLSAADILARTRGSVVWASFYGAFVVAVAIHAAIGIRNVLKLPDIVAVEELRFLAPMTGSSPTPA